MSERVFLDTNVLVYLFDADAPAKQQRVRHLFSTPEKRSRLVLNTQVLQEFDVAVTRKLASPVEPMTAFQAVQDLSSLPVVQIDPPLILMAIRRSQTARFLFCDSLIVEAALATEATQLYSEDLQHGRIIEKDAHREPIRHTLR